MKTEKIAKDSDARRVQVWDAPTRLFHWCIVALVFVSWLSADQGYMSVHMWSGVSLLALLLFRIGWGVFGSTTSRFSDFLHPPRRVIVYLRKLAGGNKVLHAGHNPAGGLMVLAMLAALFLQGTTGLFANDGLRFSGPLALFVSSDASDRITEIHGTIFTIILLLIWLHVVAVGFYFLVRGDNLVGPMVTGNKARDHVPADASITLVHPAIALALLVMSAALLGWILF